eukprot:SAG31_NODE_32_length_32319_cov_28.042681_8_plen_378_part_00
MLVLRLAVVTCLLMSVPNLGHADSTGNQKDRLRSRQQRTKDEVNTAMPTRTEPEKPDGILAEQWEQLDALQRKEVAEQVAAMRQNMAAKELTPEEFEAPVDDTVVWEEWDTKKYAQAWNWLNNKDAAGAGENSLKQRLNHLLARGWRPLHAAARNGQETVQEMDTLLDFFHTELSTKSTPAELLRDKRGMTALHVASLVGRLEAIKRLLPTGKLRRKSRAAWVDPSDRHGSRPLHLAAGAGEVGAMRLLLKSGADPESRTRAQATPLHVAASAGQTKALDLLLSHDVQAHPLLKDVRGATAGEVAQHMGHKEAADIIKDAVIQRARLNFETYMPLEKQKLGGGFAALLDKFQGKEEELLELLERVLHETKQKLKQQG